MGIIALNKATSCILVVVRVARADNKGLILTTVNFLTQLLRHIPSPRVCADGGVKINV